MVKLLLDDDKALLEKWCETHKLTYKRWWLDFQGAYIHPEGGLQGLFMELCTKAQ